MDETQVITDPHVITALVCLVFALIGVGLQMIINAAYDWKRKPRPPEPPFNGPFFPPY